MRDVGNSDQLESEQYVYQNRDKRSTGGNGTFARRSLTSAELKARVKAGEGYEQVVHANLTYVSSPTSNVFDHIGSLLPLLLAGSGVN
jgi:hypothetical protein